LALWDHLAVKLVLNTLSTATMALIGRVVGNWMVHVQASNKKLIDRSTRLIAGLTGLSYADACVALYQAIDEIADYAPDRERPSPAALAIERIG
jgi:N-acetylmuramic acid 6-phosphate etherase